MNRSSWQQVPRTAALPDRTAAAGTAIVAFLLGTIGPWSRAAALPASAPELVLGASILASIAMAWAADRWWLRATFALAAGVALLIPQGELIAAWLPASLVVADWAVRGRPPIPFLPRASPGSLGPVAICLLVGTYLGLPMSATWQPLAAVAVAAVLTLAITVAGGPIERASLALRRAGALVAWWAVATVPWVLAVAVPWLLSLVIGVDRSAERGAWVRRDRTDVQPRATWRQPVDPSPLLRPTVTAVVVTALMATMVVAIRGREIGPPQVGEPPIPAAFEDDDDGEWYRRYVEDSGWAAREEVAWRVLRDRRMLDVSTRTLNVRDGARVSWTPPPCECERLTVWVYGGSTTFGLGQRDEHTIPSWLARAAWEEGLALDVVNRGMPGHAHWTEADRFAWDLTVEPAPDLVVFYDGVNEMWMTNYLNAPETNHLWLAIEPTTEQILIEQRPSGEAPAPDGAEVKPHPTVPSRTDEDFGRISAERYARAIGMSEAIARARGVPAQWFWQPSRVARPTIDDEPHYDEEGEAQMRDQYQAARDALPSHVVDLTDVFGDDREPYFWDDLHHDEDAARIIGRALFAELEPQLRQLAAGA